MAIKLLYETGLTPRQVAAEIDSQVDSRVWGYIFSSDERDFFGVVDERGFDIAVKQRFFPLVVNNMHLVLVGKIYPTDQGSRIVAKIRFSNYARIFIWISFFQLAAGWSFIIATVFQAAFGGGDLHSNIRFAFAANGYISVFISAIAIFFSEDEAAFKLGSLIDKPLRNDPTKLKTEVYRPSRVRLKICYIFLALAILSFVGYFLLK